MSSASNPFFSLETFTPPPPMPVHPMITMPGYTQPFTLLRTGDLIQVTFTNQASANVRVFVIGYTNDPTHPVFNSSIGPIAPGAGHPQSVFEAHVSHMGGVTHLWMGAWWDDGTYNNTPASIQAYFRDHPSATGHHTVPIVIG